MIEIKLDNNEFLRQFEVIVNGSLARIEYAEQERKIFLTKIIIPREIYSKEFEESFIKKTFEFISNKNLRIGTLIKLINPFFFKAIHPAVGL